MSSAQPAAAEQGAQAGLKLAKPEMLELVHLAGLMTALAVHLRSKSKRLIGAGIPGAANIKSTKRGNLNSGFISKLPESLHKELIEDWIKEQAKGALARYLGEEGGSIDALRDDLIALRMHSLELADKPAGMHEIAKSILDCYFQPQHRALASMFGKIRRQADRPQDSKSKDIAQCVLNLDDEILQKQLAKDEPIIGLMTTAAAIHYQHSKFSEKQLANFRNRAKSSQLLEEIKNAIEEHYNAAMPVGSIPARKLAYAESGEFASLAGLEVLAKCTTTRRDSNDYPFAFSDVVAVRHENSIEWKELRKEDSSRLFPETGSIIHFSGQQLPALPESSSYGVWRVERQQSKPDVKTLCKVTSMVMPVYQVISSDGTKSSDYKELMSFLVNAERLTLGIPMLVWLGDKVFVEPPERPSIDSAAKFSRPLRYWGGLPIHQLNDGVNLHIGEVPDSARLLELGNPCQIIKRSVEQHASTTIDEREKYRRIIESMAKDESNRMLMEQTGLDDLQFRFDRLDGLVGELLDKEEIAAAIDKRATGMRGSLNDDIDSYMAKVHDIRDKVDRNKEIARNKAAELEKAGEEFSKQFDDYFNGFVALGRQLAKSNVHRKWFADLDNRCSEFEERLDKLIARNKAS